MGVVKKLAQLTRGTPDPELFDSPDDCSNLDLLPLRSTRVQLKGICGRQSPGEDVPRSALYSTPRGRTEDQGNVTFLALYKKKKMTACTKSRKGSWEWSCRILCKVFRDPAVIREMIPTMYQGRDPMTMCIQ